METPKCKKYCHVKSSFTETVISISNMFDIYLQQIVGNGVQPQLFVDGPSRFDIKQNHFENCWFLTAASAIAMREDLLYQVVPKDQSFQEDYAGIFHFRYVSQPLNLFPLIFSLLDFEPFAFLRFQILAARKMGGCGS